MELLIRIYAARKVIFSAFVLYLLMMAGLLFLTTECHVSGTDCGSNAGRALRPILGYLSTGMLIDSYFPTQAFTENPLGFAVVGYLFGVQDGVRQFLPVVLLQIVLLFASGMLVYGVTSEFWPRAAKVAMLFLIFNPNVIFVTLQPREDIYFAFFICLAMAAAFSFAKSWTWSSAIICGAALGLSANFRPTGHYLIYVIPVVFLVFGAMSEQSGRVFEGLKKGVVAAAVGWILIVPWMMHLKTAGHSFSLTDYRGKYMWSSDFHAMLADYEEREVGLYEALFGAYDDRSRKVHLNTFGPERTLVLAQTIPNWSGLAPNKKLKLQYEDMMQQFGEFSASTYFFAALPNWRYFFLSGGEGELFWTMGVHDRLEEWRDENSWTFLGLKSTFIGYSVLIKILAVFGLWHLYKIRNYEGLLMFAGVLFYFMLVHIYHGSPRYRVPVESIFAILAACGLVSIRDISQGRRDGDISPPTANQGAIPTPGGTQR